MSEQAGGEAGYTFTTYVSRNTVGGGHFDVVELWQHDRCVGSWVYDGTLAMWLSRRRRDKQIKHLRLAYGAVRR